MRVAALVLAASAAVSAPALAQTAARTYLCEGAAVSPNGEEVDVYLVRSDNGQTVIANALWFPPLARGSAPATDDQPDVVFSINYERAAPGRIGEVRSVVAVAAITSAPRANEAHSSLQRRLAAYRVDYSFDGAPAKELTMLQLGEDKTPPGSAASQADFGQVIPLPGWAELRMTQGKKGQPIVRRFVLSSTAERDSLFTKAWAEAEAKFARPAGQCEAIQ